MGIDMEKAVIILTCHNRREKTIKCLKSIIDGNKELEYTFVAVDDNSTDGTSEELGKLGADIIILEGDGNLFWNGGMHMGMEYAINHLSEADYFVMINDDVDFFVGSFDKMARALKGNTKVLVGATCDDKGHLSYGGTKYKGGKSLELTMIGPDKSKVNCETFNANCVFIPREIFLKAGSTDPKYIHSMGDFDYGFRIHKLGYEINVYEAFVGSCNDNPVTGTWQDKSLPRLKRIKLKESFKGLPFSNWFRYLRKNFGLDVAIVRSITPYIKILLGR